MLLLRLCAGFSIVVLKISPYNRQSFGSGTPAAGFGNADNSIAAGA
jgi:hypothetical protein